MDNVRKVLAKDNVDKSKMMYQGQNVLREYGCIQNCEETTKVPSNDLSGGTGLMMGLKKTD